MLAALLGLSACDRSSSFDGEAAREWSQKANVQLRHEGATYMDQNDEGEWVSISTAAMEETASGLMYSQGEVLRTGFFVYPGGHRVNTIDEAILLSMEILGVKYQSEQDAAAQRESVGKAD